MMLSQIQKTATRLHSKYTDDLKNEMIIPRSRELSVEPFAQVEALSAEEVRRLARQRLLSQIENLSAAELQRLAREELRHIKVSVIILYDGSLTDGHKTVFYFYTQVQFKSCTTLS